MRNAGDGTPGGSSGRRQRAAEPPAAARPAGNGGASLFTPAYRVRHPAAVPGAGGQATTPRDGGYGYDASPYQGTDYSDGSSSYSVTRRRRLQLDDRRRGRFWLAGGWPFRIRIGWTRGEQRHPGFRSGAGRTAAQLSAGTVRGLEPGSRSAVPRAGRARPWRLRARARRGCWPRRRLRRTSSTRTTRCLRSRIRCGHRRPRRLRLRRLDVVLTAERALAGQAARAGRWSGCWTEPGGG